jgi:hypothetical protein
MNSTNQYNWVSRTEASLITTLSKRTIDRYIEQGRVLSKKMGMIRVVIAKETLTPEFINSPKPKFL